MRWRGHLGGVASGEARPMGACPGGRAAGAGRDGPGLARSVGGAGGRERGAVRGAPAPGSGAAPARCRAEPSRPRLALAQPPRLLRTLGAGRAMGPLQVPAAGAGGGCTPCQTGAGVWTPLLQGPPGSQSPASDPFPPFLASPPASGTPRSCSPTSRTATASQGTCWSASPQVRSQAEQWLQSLLRLCPTPLQPLPALSAVESPGLRAGQLSSMPPALIMSVEPADFQPLGPGHHPTLRQGVGATHGAYSQHPPLHCCFPLLQRVTVHNPDPLSALLRPTGYFIHDTLDIIFNHQSRSSWEYLVHHAMAISAFVSLIITGRFLVAAMLLLLVEVSNIFLTIRMLLKMSNVPSPALYEANKYVNLVMYFAFRLAPQAYLTWYFLRYVEVQGQGAFLTANLLLLDAMILMYFSRLLRSDFFPSLQKGSAGRDVDAPGSAFTCSAA
uniref:Uncharacterized protein n=1 Tax=Melopsittacus undulatus TaxID=13146 RepID=A0A8V5GYC4_MELUD